MQHAITLLQTGITSLGPQTETQAKSRCGTDEGRASYSHDLNGLGCVFQRYQFTPNDLVWQHGLIQNARCAACGIGFERAVMLTVDLHGFAVSQRPALKSRRNATEAVKRLMIKVCALRRRLFFTRAMSGSLGEVHEGHGGMGGDTMRPD